MTNPKHQSQEWRKEFRKLLCSLNDLNVESKLDLNFPLKEDIYFDGIEVEQFIHNLISREREEAFEEGKIEGAIEEATNCAEHCKKAREEAIMECIRVIKDIEIFGNVSGRGLMIEAVDRIRGLLKK